ncbi:MAG: hypothetical protein ACMG6S_32915 [Byssovorax sp.]
MPMHYRRILVLAALVGFQGLALAACVGVADFHNCTREEVKDGGCEACPVTCHDYDNEDAGDASAEDAGDAG